jgi:hypothetical protein
MPDITMCSGNGCPIKDGCYRYYAKPSERQSYFIEPPYNHEVKGCPEYWTRNDREARITEVYDSNGNLAKLEAHDANTGEHIIDALWDLNDEHTPETRGAFRDWFSTYLRRKDIKPIN